MMLSAIGQPIPDTAHVRTLPFWSYCSQVLFLSTNHTYTSPLVHGLLNSNHTLNTCTGRERITSIMEINRWLRGRRRLGSVQDAHWLSTFFHSSYHSRA